MSSTKEKKSYAEVLKGTTIFGGVQVFQILIAIVQSKLIAVLIGATGIGIIGLLNSSTSMIRKFTSLGLETSAVKDISAAFANKDEEKIGYTVGAFRRLVWFTGILGTIVVIALSPWLSKLAFKNYNYTLAFIFVSVALLFNQLKVGQVVMLRGTRKIKEMAKASLLGSLASLVVIVPIYYFFGEEGIAPAIVSASLISMMVMFYFAQRIKVRIPKLNLQQLAAAGKDMLKMGFFLSLTGTIALIVVYLTRIFISNYGEIDDVGLYTAGFTIINTYVGLVFSAMGTDYFPRLSGVADNKSEFNQIINHQAEVAILLLGPIMAIFLITLKWGILILYTSEFLPIYTMLFWMGLGTYLKAASWPLGFAILAKGDSKLFFYKETFIHLLMLGLTIGGFLWKGLEGIGIGYFIAYVVNVLVLVLISWRFYKFKYNKTYIAALAIQFALGAVIFWLLKDEPTLSNYIIASVVGIITSVIAIYSLNKKINLIQFLKGKF